MWILKTSLKCRNINDQNWDGVKNKKAKHQIFFTFHCDKLIKTFKFLRKSSLSMLYKDKGNYWEKLKVVRLTEQ